MADTPAVRRRLWIPVTVIALAAGGVFGLWNWPDPEFPIDHRTGLAGLTIIVAVLLLALWLLFLSGMRWVARLGILAAAAALYFGTVRSLVVSGSLLPVGVHWRWEPTHDEVRIAERAAQEKGARIAIPAAVPEDYPEYRNRRRDGVVTGPRLTDWQARQPQRRWRQTVGGGYSGAVVVGPSLVTMEQVGGDEAVVCYDVDTGRERWSYSYPALFRDPTGNGPRATPTVADGDVYALGATGLLTRLDGATGARKWQANILSAENQNTHWGQSGSPLVYDRFVAVNPGAQTDAAKGKAVVAYDRDTGAVAWSAGDRKAGYSSPQLATIAGARQVLVFDGEALGSYDAATGRELWNHPWVTDYHVNVAQPLVFDDGRVFITSGYGHGCAMLKVTQADGKWAVETLWENKNLRCKFSSPVYHSGFIYGIDEAAGGLTCIDAKDGKRKWREGRYGTGQILLAGDVVVVGAENGRLVLVPADPTAHKELASMTVLEGSKNWNHLAVAHGRAYVRNHEMMACYDLPTDK